MKLYRLRNRVGFCIYSETAEPDFGKVINTLRSMNVQMLGLRVSKDRLYGYTRKCDFPYLRQFTDSRRLSLEVTDEQGILTVIKKYRWRFGFIAGLVLAVMMISFLSDRVMIIEISGNEDISDDRILSLLSDAGISTGSSLSAVDLRQAERDIVCMEKGIGWIGIRNTGSRVVVEVSELTEKPEMEHKNTPCNIVAKCDGQIKNVRVYSGMLTVMVGDGVRKGDVIVSGTVDTKFGRSYYVHSIAEITGIYTRKMTFSQKLVSDEQLPDGEEVRKALCIFGRRIPLGGGKITGQYEYYENETPLTLGKITFPISLIEMHYTMMRTQTVTRTEEQAETLIMQRIEKYESDLISDEGIITDRQLKKTVEGDTVTITAEYTLEGEIGTERQILAKYEPADYSHEQNKPDETEEQSSSGNQQ
ncbi:MAG: sporulation protein YqfD [Huintestinicola sp.]